MGNGIDDTQPPHGEPVPPEPDGDPRQGILEPPAEGESADAEEE
jgi:hypothetical protein